jgi:hypothetical protein
MFGERYFATRGRLSDLMGGIAELARETTTDLGGILPPLAEIEAGLGTPFLFVACGEVNAGKSTLLNGLFGHDFCRVNVLPETDRVLCYRFGDPARDVATAPLLEERLRPLDFLRDFTVVDTPGTNSAVQGHQAVSAPLLAAADLVLFVFPISNPWGAATWDAISRLPATAMDRLVLVIQQADQRDANDIRVILGHMADLAMKRLGRVPPIFAVSGKLACQAKHQSPTDANLLPASGYPALEDFISNKICLAPGRRQALESWRGQATTALRTVEDRIEKQSGDIRSHGSFIDQVEREIDAIREQFVTRLTRHLAGVAEVFENEAVIVTKLLRRRLRALPSMIRLFTGDRTGPTMEAVFVERLQAAIEAVARQDGDEVADACRRHWQDLTQRVASAMGVNLLSTEPIDETLTQAKQRFVQTLGLAAREGIGNLKVRNQLDKELRLRNLALKSFLFMTLALTTVGAVCGALGVPWFPIILCGMAALFLTGCALAAWATRAPITRDFQQRLLDTCGTFASTLHSDYEEALRIVFQDYAAGLGNVRNHLVREKLAIEPRLRRWQELFLTLKAIEQDL